MPKSLLDSFAGACGPKEPTELGASRRSPRGLSLSRTLDLRRASGRLNSPQWFDRRPRATPVTISSRGIRLPNGSEQANVNAYTTLPERYAGV